MEITTRLIRLKRKTLASHLYIIGLSFAARLRQQEIKGVVYIMHYSDLRIIISRGTPGMVTTNWIRENSQWNKPGGDKTGIDFMRPL